MPAQGPIVVFVGPSLPAAFRPTDPRFDWWGPAVAGDAYRMIGSSPEAVVLIDGLFDEQPAIRHKELLDLMARGVPVIGGASMGALRAAELAAFGMIGVGRVFDSFIQGYLVGDDEVALLHGPEESDWLALTEPLVNIRATLMRAVRELVVDVEAARLVLTVARRIFYKARTWPSMFEAIDDAALPGAARAMALQRWLPAGRVDVKRLDALACLERARYLSDADRAPRPPPPRTLFTEALIAGVGLAAANGPQPGGS
jgi:hypothetical protein